MEEWQNRKTPTEAEKIKICAEKEWLVDEKA